MSNAVISTIKTINIVLVPIPISSNSIDVSLLGNSRLLPSSIGVPTTSSLSLLLPYHSTPLSSESSSLASLLRDSLPSILEVPYPFLVVDLLIFLSLIYALPSELVVDLPPQDAPNTTIILFEPKPHSKTKGIPEWQEAIEKEF